MYQVFRVFWKKIDGIIMIQLPFRRGVFVVYIPEDELTEEHDELRHLISPLQFNDEHVNGWSQRFFKKGLIEAIKEEHKVSIGVPSFTPYRHYWFEIHPNITKGEYEDKHDKDENDNAHR